MCQIININFPFVHGQKSSKGVSQFQYESRGKNKGICKIRVPNQVEKIKLEFRNQREFNEIKIHSRFIRNYPDLYLKLVG
jgi:hypothetical protein